MYNPGTWYYGWHMYGVTDTPVVISNCTISARGATDVLPVYVYGDSQVVITNGLDLVNMPNETPSSGYSWSGYPLANPYESSRDSDGDGLNDYEEVVGYGTDPYLKDSDGDRISDMDEILHGASPTNQEVYCFGLTATITNAFENVDSVKLAFYEQNTGDRISEIAEVSNRIDSVELHCLVNGTEKPVLRMWSATEESYVAISYGINGHNNATVIQSSLIGQLYDADNDEIPDDWETCHGLSSQAGDDALEDLDGDGLINLHEYWASSNPSVSDATNTLLSLCARSVDDRLSGKTPATTLNKFNNYVENGTNFALNVNFWASDVDTSCVSMWNDATQDFWGGICSQWHKAGTAISKRHIVTAWHYAIPSGTTVWFMGNDGVPCSRVVTGYRSIGGDICVQVLDQDLPDNVVPVKILPDGYANYIRTGKRLPVVTFDQEEKLIVADSAAFKEYQSRSEATGALRPYNSTRLMFYEPVVSGDSGSPRFLIMGNKVVLLSVMHYGGTGSGCFITHYKTEIQEAMDILCPGYELEEVDLDGYDSID